MKYSADILKKLNEVKTEPLPVKIAKASGEIESAYKNTMSKMKSLPDVGDAEAAGLASAAISSAVKEEGVVTEVGAEKVHTSKFDRCVTGVRKKSPDVDPYAVCQASLGAGAIKKGHRRKPEDEYVRTNETKDIKSIEDIEASEEDYEEELKIKQAMGENSDKPRKVNKKIALFKIKNDLEEFINTYDFALSEDELQRLTDAVRSMVSIINLTESKVKLTKGQLTTLIESVKKNK